MRISSAVYIVFCLSIIRTYCYSQTVPGPAAIAGYNRLAFIDDFESSSTIDVLSTGAAGFNWYTDRPFGWSSIPQSSYSVSNSILTLLQTNETKAGWWLSSYSRKGNRGNAFRYGYFECRMRFDPTLGVNTDWFPCWWSFSVSHSTEGNNTRWGELDFFEAYTGGYATYNGRFYGTVHDWNGVEDIHYQNSNNWTANADADYNQWHVYGCMWTPGKITWYFDDKPMKTLLYSADQVPVPQSMPAGPVGTFSILDREYMQLVLGTASKDWPLEIDWVRVWQQTSTSTQDNIETSEFKVYPIPCNDKLTVEIASALDEKVQIEMFDTFGKKKLVKVSNTNMPTFSVTELPSGIYFIQISSSSFVETQKIVIQH